MKSWVSWIMEMLSRCGRVPLGILLFITGFAKVWSSVSGGEIMDVYDPVFMVKYRDLWLVLGIVELVVSRYVIWGRAPLISYGLLSIFGILFIIYRLGLGWIGEAKPCPCLGTFTDSIGIGFPIFDLLLKIACVCMVLVGACGLIMAKKGEDCENSI